MVAMECCPAFQSNVVERLDEDTLLLSVDNVDVLHLAGITVHQS